ncbi:MAG: hypothetical protein BJG00_014995 [Limnothrix sp. CACIAM 69d]|nr:MAG: hypothetical protein BJG00_014995 [Limnothrix sp. CACIAM 69d]
MSGSGGKPSRAIAASQWEKLSQNFKEKLLKITRNTLVIEARHRCSAGFPCLVYRCTRTGPVFDRLGLIGSADTPDWPSMGISAIALAIAARRSPPGPWGQVCLVGFQND